MNMPCKSLVGFWLLISSGSSLACSFESVTFKTDFSAGRLDQCTQTGAYQYQLLIKPENEPINPSPWYAFKVSAKERQTIEVTIQYQNAKHRYAPKVSMDGAQWQLLAHEAAENSVSFQLAVANKPLWVAGQEIRDAQYYENWLAELVRSTTIKPFVLGKSIEGRNIKAFENLTDTNRWLILIGRQHPPEVTGAMAMLPFVETLMADTGLAKAFRQKFNILVVPLMNPDGVENGNWRHNSKGVDLNRDWSKFEQMETRLVRDRMQQIVANGGKIEFAVDFHSTWKNVFYTMPQDYGLEKPDFSHRWLTNLGQALPDFEVEEKPGTSPGRGVFKQYIADTYGVHAITYEVADRANRNEIHKVATVSATELMKLMLQ